MYSIQDVDKLSTVYFPWAITSTAKENAGANNTHDHLVMSLAPAFYAQAVYVQDYFGFAAAAVNRKACCLGVAADPKQSFISFAHRTGDVSFLHFNYSTIVFTLQ